MTANNPSALSGRTISDHGVVGNLETVALVASDATIDYLCWPELDSPTIFAGLLDPDSGTFDVRPTKAGFVTRQLYRPETNILITRWMWEDASAEIIDFMPYPGTAASARMVVRSIRMIRGTADFVLHCSPRPDYGRVMPKVEQRETGVLFTAPELTLRLDGAANWQLGEGFAHAEIALEEGQRLSLVLSDGENAPLGEDGVENVLEKTSLAWRHWACASTYKGRWRESVTRSALVLKLLTSAQHGSIAAAATFGLPEAIGGERNWDYRATWIRDAAFTVYAFLRLGFGEEAEHFREWLDARAQSADALRIVYRLDGSEVTPETELGHMEGYRGSKPVRIGNGARSQTQLDIFGELMDTIYLCNKYGKATSRSAWLRIVEMVDFVGQNWQTADAGIWELRDRERHLLHSRLMCWVCVDRAVRLANKRSFTAPLVEWIALRDAIAHDIWDNFRHPEHGYFVQERGGTELDAAILMMPLVRFVSATDPVWLDTLDAIGAQLTSDSLVWRYRSADGLAGEDGAFTTCMFWYVECLARAGRLSEAQLQMEKCLGLGNHLGLFSEELDRRGFQLGNFPQALTHLALISAAYFLDRRLDRSAEDEWQP